MALELIAARAPAGLVIVFAALCASCGGAGEGASAPIASAKPAAPPAADLSTPDRGLRSYWALKDHVERTQRAIGGEVLAKMKAVRQPLGTVTIGEYARDLTEVSSSTLESFTRDIVEVKVESDSRAVILATVRNTTPVPAGAEAPKKFMEQEREKGERFRYILEKDKDGWKVAEIWDWEEYITKGWRKRYPTDRTPSYPYMAWGGI